MFDAPRPYLNGIYWQDFLQKCFKCDVFACDACIWKHGAAVKESNWQAGDPGSRNLTYCHN